MICGRAGARAKTGDGPVRIARAYKLAKARTQAVSQLMTVLVCAGPALREALSPLGNPARFRRCAQLASDTGFLGQRLSAAGGVLEEDPAACPARGRPWGPGWTGGADAGSRHHLAAQGAAVAAAGAAGPAAPPRPGPWF